jgi:hypothetical protein
MSSSVRGDELFPALPFFTANDPELVRATAVRDPLGLLPVWSGVGRELVPHLASGVYKLSGIKAVLLIHWLLQEPLKEVASRNFRACFRLLEGLLEYYLWAHANAGQCFGTRALSRPDGFRLFAHDAGTAVNGLYQYYSGTCRRAELVDAEWTVLPDVATAFRRCWSTSAVNALRHGLERVLDDIDRQAFEPKQVLDGTQVLARAIGEAFDSTALMTVMRDRVLGNAAQVAFARHCADIRQQASGQPKVDQMVDDLALRLRDDREPASALRPSLTRVSECEHFLVLVQDAFDLMRALERNSLGQAAKWMEPSRAVHRDRAQRFAGLYAANAGERDEQIAALANALTSGPTESFLQEVINHHQRLMKERGSEPLLSIDEGKIVSLLGAERSLITVQDHMNRGLPWNNGYYLSTAGAIHSQLFGTRT